MTVLQQQYEDTLRQNKKLVAALKDMIAARRDSHMTDREIAACIAKAESLLRDLGEI